MMRIEFFRDADMHIAIPSPMELSRLYWDAYPLQDEPETAAEPVRQKPSIYAMPGPDADDSELCAHAEKIANYCKNWTQMPWVTPMRAAEALSGVADKLGADVPEIGKRGVTCASFCKRLCDVKFWRRQIRTIHARAIEMDAIADCKVGKGRALFLSDDAMHRARRARRRNQAMLENTLATNQDDQTYTLAELSEAGVSNPEVKKAELMVRVRGLERIAQANNMAGFFVTLTCPSRFHRYDASGRPNPKWTGLSPRHAQEYLNKVWALIRSACSEGKNREKIHVIGFRGTEPHKSGCPHWHMALFCDQRHAERLQEIIAQYALQDSGREVLRNASIRVEIKPIDWSKGASGYILFYVTKNIDGTNAATGEGIGDHDEGGDNVSGAERVRAWASLWGIRQFQLIGTAPVTIWRELRRMQARLLTADDGEAPAAESLAELLKAVERQERSQQRLKKHFAGAVGEGSIWPAAVAADKGDWSAFVEAMGGYRVGRGAELVRPMKDRDIENQYGEKSGQKVIGVYDPETGCGIKTKVNTWKIERKQGREDRAAMKRFSWTRVNNCHTAEKRLAWGLVRKWQKQERAGHGQVESIESRSSGGEQQAVDAGGQRYKVGGGVGGGMHRQPATITGRRRPAGGIAGAFG